jgi:non-specific serine/threonine protein kinase
VIAALSDELAHARLVTVTGPAGVGKSRLAREVARSATNWSKDGVIFVDLESVSDPALAVEVVAGMLGPPAASDVEAAVVRSLMSGEKLLVLDCCEHVMASVGGLIESLLRSCPALRVLTTSQQVLHLAGEHVFPLAPLAVPDEERLSPEALLAFEAAELFVSHARAACPGLALDSSGAAAVARICRSLDGLPLALELVAPRARTMGMDKLADAVEAGMSFSETPLRGPSRHRSMEAALTWSVGLLSPGERRLLEVLSVFVGGADAAALANVLNGTGLQQREVIEGLSGLLDKSVVSMSMMTAEGVARYDLLGVVRRYVKAGLQQQGRFEALARLQLAWCLEMVAGAEEALISGPHQTRLLDLIAGNQANLRGALEFALGSGDAEAAERLACGLWRFWELRGQLSEGRRWLERVLAARPASVARSPSRETSYTHLLDGAGMLAWRQGDYVVATSTLEEALSLASDCGDVKEAARIANHLGLVALFSGDVVMAEGLFERSRDALERLDSPGEAALACANLALVAIEEGRLDEACELLNCALATQYALGDRHGRAISLLHRAIARYYLGDSRCAQEEAHEAAQVFLELSDERSLGFALLVLAAVLARQHPALALELAGLATALRERIGADIPFGWGARQESALEPARLALGSEADAFVRNGAATDPTFLLAQVRAAIPGPPANSAEEPWASVKLLGHFQVRHEGHPVYLAPQVARLVKLLAATGQPVHVEQAIETLWPEVDPERGRRRLRNVLARLRRAVGPIVMREGQLLLLAPGVAIDAVRFSDEARQAIDAFDVGEGGPASRRQARIAAELYSGDLLAEDLYEDWASDSRERLRRLRLRLLDAWSAAASAEGDLAEAEACLREGIEADPTDEGRYLSLARLLAGSGRTAAAAAVLSRARAKVDELGLPFSTAIAELDAILRAGSIGT